PVALAPARDQRAGHARAGDGIALEQRHAVLAGEAHVLGPGVAGCAPSLEIDAAVVEREQRGQPGLKLAEDAAALDEAVVPAAVLAREGAAAEGAVAALE